MLSVSSTPTLAKRRTERAHDVRHDVHRAAAHRAVEPAAHLAGRSRRAPSSCWSGPASSLFVRADEGKVLGARDVVGVGAMQITAGPLARVERNQHAGRDRFFYRRWRSSSLPSHQWTRSGLVRRTTSATHSDRARFSMAFFLAISWSSKVSDKFGFEDCSLDLPASFGSRESLLSDRQSLQHY